MRNGLTIAGEVLFDESRMGYMTSAGATTDNPRRNGQFLGALFRQEMLAPNGVNSIAHNPERSKPSVKDYPVPDGGTLWNGK